MATPPYGLPIDLESAKRAASAATSEMRKHDWRMAIAVVDPAGDLVYFEKVDGTQTGSVDVAISKARSAARFKRATKMLQDALTASPEGIRLLAIEGAVPVEGGVPIVVNGHIVGAIGVSGAASSEDGLCAQAGANALSTNA